MRRLRRARRPLVALVALVLVLLIGYGVKACDSSSGDRSARSAGAIFSGVVSGGKQGLAHTGGRALRPAAR